MNKCLGSFGGGLFGCFSDIPTCLCGTFIPCCLTAKTTASLRHEECGVCHLLHWEPIFYHRKQLAGSKGFVDDAIVCAVVTFCGPCAICQHGRAAK